DMRDQGHRRWELLLLAGGSAGLIGLREIADSGPLLGVLFVGSLLVLAFARLIRSERRPGS
ncbi:MAG: hypothetical protein NDI67_10880, partial [Sulfuritalea sp.]|nr:hypothetical protein [Sulfuritalea sp.]